jgi:hypothetical protein
VPAPSSIIDPRDEGPVDAPLELHHHGQRIFAVLLHQKSGRLVGRRLGRTHTDVLGNGRSDVGLIDGACDRDAALLPGVDVDAFRPQFGHVALDGRDVAFEEVGEIRVPELFFIAQRQPEQFDLAFAVALKWNHGMTGCFGSRIETNSEVQGYTFGV